MADTREDILARLVVVIAAVEGVEKASRSRDFVPDDVAPVAVIMDADEQANDEDPFGRAAGSPRLVVMTPEIWITLGGASDDIGTDINALRALIIKAVLFDTTLLGYTVNKQGIRYEACATNLTRGRTMQADMGISFSFTYVMNPNLL